MTEQHSHTLYRATISIPELGARPGDYVAVFSNNVQVVRELPGAAKGAWVGVRVALLTPEMATHLRAVR